MNKNIIALGNKISIIEKYINKSGTLKCDCLDKKWLSEQFKDLTNDDIRIVIERSVILLNNKSQLKSTCLNNDRILNGFISVFPNKKYDKYIDYWLKKDKLNK
jgi:hypothetical protein